MPAYVVTDQGQYALKGGGGWKRVRWVTITGDTSTYQTTGWAITTASLSATATLLFPNAINGCELIATSGAVSLTITYDKVNNTMRMYTSGTELGTGNSTSFTASQVIYTQWYGT